MTRFDMVIEGGIVTPDGLIDRGCVAIAGDRIQRVERTNAKPAALKLSGRWVLPGFVALHVHGALGHDFTDPRPDLGAVLQWLAGDGYTSVLATLVSSPPDVIGASLSRLADDATDLTTLAGVHFEGPFINNSRRGSHLTRHLCAPDLELARRWIEQGPRGWARMITLAPELPGAIELARALAAEGLVVAAGHSAATYDQARRAIDAGILHATHLFNACSPLGHRDPGIPGAYLVDPNTTVEIIPDLEHVHPAVLAMVWQLKGRRGCTMATDLIAPAGLGDGSFPWAGQTVHVRGARATLHGGILAGGVASTGAVLRNLSAVGLSPEDLAAVLATTPARVAGLKDRGRLEQGCRGDVVVLNEDLAITHVVAGGRVVSASGARPDPALAAGDGRAGRP